MSDAMSNADAVELAYRLRVAYVLDVPCIHCGAIQGVWCATTSGRRSQDLHRHRRDLAGRQNAYEALARYVQPLGWVMNGGAA